MSKYLAVVALLLCGCNQFGPPDPYCIHADGARLNAEGHTWYIDAPTEKANDGAVAVKRGRVRTRVWQEKGWRSQMVVMWDDSASVWEGPCRARQGENDAVDS